ncbi:outer membrane protein assembly factor BamE domain-containing protein [Candidatus Pelagibacter sp. HIMB1521]|uniref:outer membrane protein assembly factor BamE domain-containing protein n=1 Tax=Candidatus Pelagibacter sp. HIMB1521 TaxID=3413344 RepID=UPI003F879B51
MKKIIYIIFVFIIFSNCSFEPVVYHHGVHFLKKKQSSLIINKTNKNDIKKILGNPSTKSKFDNDIWIYIERKETASKIKNLGRVKVFENNVLVLEIDKYGILKEKKFYDKNSMENIKISKNDTNTNFEKNSFIYNFFSSMRQKLNDPLGTRANKRKDINQR